MDEAAIREYPLLRGRKPLTITRAEGCTLFADDGREILDAAGGAIVANVGHGRREVARAYADAVERLSYAVPPFASEARLALVARLRERWLPPTLTRAVFTSGGAEAMDVAIRLVRQHFVSKGEVKRWKVVGRDLSYHGTTLTTLSIGGHERRRRGFEPWLIPSPRVPAHYCLRCPLGRSFPSCDVACADALEAVIAREGRDSIAAFVAEPVGGSTAGALTPPEGYWQRIREICSHHGILVVADEVMSGFGRTGKRFAIEHTDVLPDILVSGKGLTGGYAPMAGLFATDAVAEPIEAAGDELMFYTYSAHTGACAAADRVLDILEREQLVARAARMGARLREQLQGLAAHPRVAEIRGRGLLIGIELVRDRESLEPYPLEARFGARVVAAGLKEGVFFYAGGCDPARDVITLGPPFTISEEEILRIAQTLEFAIDQAARRIEERV